MPGGFHRWSRTAATNSTADSTIGWAEGQAPSTVNDSARAMMARAAEYRDDVSGVTATAGAANTYTFASYQTLTALVDGYKVTFTCNVTNTGASTLNVDSMGAKALRALTGVALSAGAMTTGSIYSATYDSGVDEWILHGYYNNFTSFPATTAMLFVQTSAPTGWTKSATHNDKTLRVVSGTASSGGSSPFSTVFGLTATSGYTLLTADIPSHAHTISDPTHIHSGTFTASGTAIGGGQALDDGSGSFKRSSSQAYTIETPAASTGIIGTAAAGGGGSHAHNIDMRVSYVDVICAIKD